MEIIDICVRILRFYFLYLSLPLNVVFFFRFLPVQTELARAMTLDLDLEITFECNIDGKWGGRGRRSIFVSRRDYLFDFLYRYYGKVQRG